MKTCGYCGRENESEAAACAECGTEFVAPATQPASSSQPRDWNWLQRSLVYCAVAMGVVSLYLLSFGPISRYFAMVTISAPVTTTIGSSSTMTVTRTVKYPSWVYFIYYPASLFRDWGAYHETGKQKK